MPIDKKSTFVDFFLFKNTHNAEMKSFKLEEKLPNGLKNAQQ
jgi:hypothetical protein